MIELDGRDARADRGTHSDGAAVPRSPDRDPLRAGLAKRELRLERAVRALHRRVMETERLGAAAPKPLLAAIVRFQEDLTSVRSALKELRDGDIEDAASTPCHRRRGAGEARGGVSASVPR